MYVQTAVYMQLAGRYGPFRRSFGNSNFMESAGQCLSMVMHVYTAEELLTKKNCVDVIFGYHCLPRVLLYQHPRRGKGIW
mmetsp:Transcript_10971/g.27220  ORF Transcript_10971/g.27220 Transcript_10971/m.27220 type:complete len:80 (+) Transcript_10971:37-276(+)